MIERKENTLYFFDKRMEMQIFDKQQNKQQKYFCYH